MKKQQGFTLIELMIVVAVIGVLSAIAVPQYQKYVAKSEAASALATIAALKTNIETAIAENGVFPTLVATAEGSNDYGVPKLEDIKGTIAFTAGADKPGGEVIYAFTDGKSSSLLEAGTIKLTRDKDGNWICNTKFGAGTDKTIIPNNCTHKA